MWRKDKDDERRCERCRQALCDCVLIMTIALIVLMLFAVGGCRARREVVLPERTVTIERTVHTERIDTVVVEVPTEMQERETRDTVSRLETSWAESEARVDSAGVLRHWLRNKAGGHRVQVVTRTDTIRVESERERSVAVEVERPLGWWERARLTTWWWLVGALVAAMLAIFIFTKKIF